MLVALLLLALPQLSLDATKTVLDNGLTVIVSPDHSVPGVAVDTWYRVGSRDEQPGRTGFAHLFEHLMFMGARHVPYPKFDTIMEAAGGVNNASTSLDVTNYYDLGPSNLLETFLWMEADRLASLGATMTAEKLETQRLVVLNERRQSYENRPYGIVVPTFYEAFFPKSHPYSWPTIGSAKDLEAATLDDVKSFFSTWYVPNDAVLVVTGDVEPDAVVALARKYFGFIPRKELPKRTPPPPLVLDKELRVQLTDKVELSKVVISWPSPAGYTPGDAEADLIASVLARGKASRLYERLVYQDELATQVSANQASQELQGFFQIDATARPGHGNAELIAAIDDELKKLLAEGATEAELASSRTRLNADYARNLEGLQPRAQLLASYEVHFGDPKSLQRDLARYEQATTASVKATAAKVFGPGRLIIEVNPQPKQAQAGGAK